MTEENKVVDATKEISFHDGIDWSSISYNRIPKDEFLKIRELNKKCYATFLGPGDTPYFYMFIPLSWGKYKEIKSKQLDRESTHEYIINSCLVWPKPDPLEISELDSGIMLTLVYQICAVSNFLADPETALQILYEC